MSGYQLKVKNKTDKADALKDKLEKINRALAEKQSKSTNAVGLGKEYGGLFGCC